MRTLRSFLFLVLLLSASLALADLHVVFDLDGTLIRDVTELAPEQRPNAPEEHVIRWKDRVFVMTDFAPEVLARLRDAGYRISFFSGGEAERNRIVVERLERLVQARSGRALNPHKVLSYEHLTPLFGRDQTARFRDRFRKDLQHVADPFDVVLVDDIREFAMDGQEKSLLHIDPEFRTVRQEQKLVVVMEVLLQARELLARSPVQYLHAVQGLARGLMPGAGYDDVAFLEMMRKGLERFRLPLRLGERSYPLLLQVRSCRAVFAR